MIGLAFAGVGWLGESLIADISRVPPLTVVAVQDVDLERARTVASRCPGAWAGDNYDDLLRVNGVDAVVICTPNALHAVQAQAALRADKDVLVQKPLALSSRDAQACIDVSLATGRLLFVDYSYRFLETIAVLRSQLKGQVRAVHAAFHNIYGPGADKRWFFDRRMSGGGALIDLGVHLLDLALWLLQPRKVILVEVHRDDDGPVEHAAGLHLLLDEVSFDLDVSWNADRPMTEISIALELDGDCTVRWQNVDGSFFRFRTLRDNIVLVDKETTLREDTLRAFSGAMQSREAPAIDVRVYEILDQAYA